MAAISTALRVAGASAGGIGSSGQLLASSVGMVSDAITHALGPLQQFTRGVQALNTSFVGVFNPGVVRQFDMATRDLYATIGEMLVPITKAATEAIKYFSSVFNGLSPIIREFITAGLDAMKPAFEAIVQGQKEFLSLAVPVAKVFGVILVDMIRLVADVVTKLANRLRDLYQSVREFLGLPEFKAKDATGKAAANTSQQNVQGYLTNLQLSALKMGQDDPARQQVSLLKDIYTQIATLSAQLQMKIRNAISGLPAEIAVKLAAVILNNLPLPRFDNR